MNVIDLMEYSIECMEDVLIHDLKPFEHNSSYNNVLIRMEKDIHGKTTAQHFKLAHSKRIYSFVVKHLGQIEEDIRA